MNDELETRWIDCLTCDGAGRLSLADGGRCECHDCHGAGGHAELVPDVPGNVVGLGLPKHLARIAAGILF
jgi:hypothetical protein